MQPYIWENKIDGNQTTNQHNCVHSLEGMAFLSPRPHQHPSAGQFAATPRSQAPVSSSLGGICLKQVLGTSTCFITGIVFLNGITIVIITLPRALESGISENAFPRALKSLKNYIYRSLSTVINDKNELEVFEAAYSARGSVMRF